MELRAGPAAGLTVSRRRLAALLATALALIAALAVLPSPAAADELQQPPSPTTPPPGFARSAVQVIAIADRTPAARGERRRHPGLRPGAYVAGGRWQVSYLWRGKELAQVIVDDRTGAVLEAWTGPQVAWKMARGYPGAFGRRVNAPYVWLPLCVLFLLPFVDPRRPFRLLHLDLLVLLAFGASHYFFNRGEIGLSVPLVYPVLGYLLGRMLLAGFRPRAGRGPLVPLVPATWLVVGIVFLVGFRVGLNVTDSNVIDVGYSGVVGADRIAHGSGLYDGFAPPDNERWNTYGPVAYLAYLPFERALPWSGRWDDLPAAHAAALAFDLATLLGLLLLGRRLRGRGREGRELGLALGYAWAAYPYTLYALESNANDALVAALLVLALLALGSAPRRGALLGLAAATKFAPLALAPLFLRLERRRPGAARGSRGPRVRARARGGRLPDLRGAIRGRRRTGPRGGALRRPELLFAAALGLLLVAVFAPFVPSQGGLGAVYERTIGFQAGRDSPFSVWGQVPSLGWLHVAVEAGAVGLAVLVAVVPRRAGPAQVAALAAAVLVAVELALTHWFYLYVVWFAPLVLVALFTAHPPARPAPARSSAPARRRPRRSPPRSATGPPPRSRSAPASG